ncbi:DUF5132 domain-containing protein [Trinickia sp. EG282A]|uniref:DUF5132 domain-containing protein n=1 Tax=Trinickia sp. EG282A TaxID=3237013 RepID=UPI0034D2A374
MAGLDDFFRGNLLAGLAVGVGAVVLAPVVLPVVAAVSKPLAKSVIKTGVILFDKGREAAAEMAEVFEDLVAEARAELEHQHPREGAIVEGMSAAGAAHGANGGEAATSSSSQDHPGAS